MQNLITKISMLSDHENIFILWKYIFEKLNKKTLFSRAFKILIFEFYK